MTKKVLIYGAGAIGRGFLGPLLKKNNIELSFVDTNKELIDKMKAQKKYKTATIKNDKYEILEIPVKESFLLGEEKNIEQYDIVFCCVGPKNCYSLFNKFIKAKAVISCENDFSTAVKLRELSGNKNIYFGIPDVITSHTSSLDMIEQDPLMTTSETGILVVEKGNYLLPLEIEQLNKTEMTMHWRCKFFIHNAPHATAAYLGWLKGYQYIHQAMADPDINEVVEGSIIEITEGVKIAKYATNDFAEMYKEKELNRFRNKLLYDPIIRVAREPIRKLAKDNRIVLGLRIAQFGCKTPKYTAMGAKAALAYNNNYDSEALSLQNFRQSIGDNEVLKKVSDIELNDPLNQYITDQDISKFTKTIQYVKL